MVGHSAKLLSEIKEPAGLSKQQVRPGGHCQQPRAQNLRVPLLWGDDSKAEEYVASLNRGEFEPLRRSHDQVHTLFANSPRVYSNRFPAFERMCAIDSRDPGCAHVVGDKEQLHELPPKSSRVRCVVESLCRRSANQTYRKLRFQYVLEQALVRRRQRCPSPSRGAHHRS